MILSSQGDLLGPSPLLLSCRAEIPCFYRWDIHLGAWTWRGVFISSECPAPPSSNQGPEPDARLVDNQAWDDTIPDQGIPHQAFTPRIPHFADEWETDRHNCLSWLLWHGCGRSATVRWRWDQLKKGQNVSVM